MLFGLNRINYRCINIGVFPTVRKIAKSPVVIKGALLLPIIIMIIFEGKTRQLIRFYRVYQSWTQGQKLENNPSEEFQVGPISSLAIHKKSSHFTIKIVPVHVTRVVI